MKKTRPISNGAVLFKHLAVFILVTIISVSANAQVWLTENFEYNEGGLYNQGNWMRYGSHTTAPIQIIDAALTYPDYQDIATGKAIKLETTSLGEKLQKQFTTEGTGGSTIYVSALMNFKEVDIESSQEAFFFNLVSRQNNKDFADGGSGNEFLKLYAKKGTEEGKFNLGVSRFNFTINYSPEEYNVSETYLIIIKYEVIEGGNNDEVSLFVNPVIQAAEPSPNAIYNEFSGSDLNLTYGGFEAIELRQGSTDSRTSPEVVIDAIRIASSWAELFNLETPSTPMVIVDKKSIVFGEVFGGVTYTETINVKGKNLQRDITINGLSTGEITPSVVTIPKEEAESEEGYNLVLTFLPSNPNIYMDNLILETTGIDNTTIDVFWSTTILEEISTLTALRSKDPEAWATYKMTGEAIISHIYKDGAKTYYYLQDDDKGITVYDAFGDLTEEYKQGDKVKGMIGTLSSTFGSLSFIPSISTLGEKISSNNNITPLSLTLKELTENGTTYESRLLKVENVKFEGIEAGALFEENMTQPTINDGTANAKMRIFKGVDYIGTPIPEECNLVGIPTAGNGTLLAPRSLADIQSEAKLEITSNTLESKKTDINIPTDLGTITLLTQGLPAEVTLEITGTNRDFFRTSVTSIPTTERITEVTIEYIPTIPGTHTGNLFIDCRGAEELSQSIRLSGVATDPANLPTFSVNSSDLTEFSAEVGKEQKDTVYVTTNNLIDWLNIKVMGESGGNFLISTTMLTKDVEAVPLVITFKPTKAGTFTERIEFSSLETPTYYLTISGTATDPQGPPVREGDSFPLDTSNPLLLLNEKFDNITHNKVLSIDKWKTIAEQNLRAWWGYEFKDEDEDEEVIEKSAKVTAYSYNIEEGAPHEMWLITPPLDFKNSASKMFTFRVMGDFLVEGQDAELGVYYLDMEEEELYKEQLTIDIPKISDENQEWREFHISFENQNIADVFFMGFRFTGRSGNINSAVYYIDDVSYGRSDLPSLSVQDKEINFTVLMDTDFTSEPFTITANNLTEPITLLLGGPDADKFELSENSLSTEGGNFTIDFSGSEPGIYTAAIKVSSRGAADLYLLVTANVVETVSIEDVIVDMNMEITVYDVTGRILIEKNSKSCQEILDGLSQGTYILRKNMNGQINTEKIIIPKK